MEASRETRAYTPLPKDRPEVPVRGARVVSRNTTRSSLAEERLQRSWGRAWPEAACTPAECHCYGGLTHTHKEFVYSLVP